MAAPQSTMRQVWITRHGGPEVLALREAAMPQPANDQILIKVAASGVNFADIMARLGVYPDAPKPPCVVGYEVAGEIVAAGPAVTAFSTGDRVVALTRFGGYSSHVCVPERQAFALPGALGFAEGAALPVTYLTAYQLMIAMGRLGAGETVLVHSAGGGVGLAAIDLAGIIGAQVIGVASAAKHDFLRRRGVMGLIDSRSKGLVSQVMALTEGRGVDLALDARGGELPLAALQSVPADERQSRHLRRQHRPALGPYRPAARRDGAAPGMGGAGQDPPRRRPLVPVGGSRSGASLHRGPPQHRQGRARAVTA